jgi:DNA-binding beta-propeller fold protein YncE
LVLVVLVAPHLKASVTYPVGNSPVAVAFDGTNIWVTNYYGNNVTKLLASTGATLGTYPVGTNPSGVAFDAANIWVVNRGSNDVTKLLGLHRSRRGRLPRGNEPRWRRLRRRQYLGGERRQ